MKRILFLLTILLLVACSRTEPTIPPPHEMPPLPTTVPREVLPLSYTLLSPTNLDDGWHGAPCPIARPFFCIYAAEDETAVASLSLSVFALSGNQVMQELLAAEELALGHTPRPTEAVYNQTAREILAELAARDLEAATQAKELGYEVLPLVQEPVEIGPLPGLSLGHMVQSEEGAILDFSRHYVAFDGDTLYWLTLLYDETAVFPDDVTALEQMAPLEAAAVALLPHLRLPVRVMDTEVERVRVEMRVTVTAVQGEGFVQMLYGGELLTVQGVSEDGNWWYVACPEDSPATSCWLPNDTGRVRPR